MFDYFPKTVQKFEFHWNRIRIHGTLPKDRYTILIISRSVLLRMNKIGNVRTTYHLGTFVLSLLVWKSNKYYIFWECVCTLRYPACNAHVPYCLLLPTWINLILHLVFPHYAINGTIFGKKSYWTQNLFRISTQLLSETFLILRRIQWDMIKNV